MKRTRFETLLVGAALLGAAAPAAAGSLDLWEDSRGARGVTASFPTGAVQSARIVFDASSAEKGGLLVGASEIEIRATGSISFTAFDCELQGCTADDWVLNTGTESANPPGRLAVSDPDALPKSGLYELGTITFDAPVEPGAMPLVNCNYTDLELNEHSCDPFVLVTLPEPAGLSALFCAAAMLFGPLRRRREAA
jgi:hypothetical protein